MFSFCIKYKKDLHNNSQMSKKNKIEVYFF